LLEEAKVKLEAEGKRGKERLMRSESWIGPNKFGGFLEKEEGIHIDLQKMIEQFVCLLTRDQSTITRWTFLIN
jgi:hypothetical protein